MTGGTKRVNIVEGRVYEAADGKNYYVLTAQDLPKDSGLRIRRNEVGLATYSFCAEREEWRVGITSSQRRNLHIDSEGKISFNGTLLVTLDALKEEVPEVRLFARNLYTIKKAETESAQKPK